jgi:YVTN family beta-propeller protein
MPPPDPTNVYAFTRPGAFADAVKGALPRVYVPNSLSGTVSVIDPATRRVVDTFPTAMSPQHVAPSWDLRTLWVNNNTGSLTPIDPLTGKPGKTRPVVDPYNMYFTPDGREMIIVAEALKRLDFRDPHTLELHSSTPVPCDGVNHLDFSADGRYFVASCEFGGKIIKVDTTTHQVLGELRLGDPERSMPQDVRLAPNGKLFYVADMRADGVHQIDGDRFLKTGFVATGTGAHAVQPSRDATRLYVTNRGWHQVSGGRKGPGSISVLDAATGAVVANWPIPGGGSPDMGNVSNDGSELWVSGRYDNEVYCLSTVDGSLLARIPVERGPHGLTIWPQPGRYSLGHTGNLR